MRLAFAGTPGFAATILRGLLDSEHHVGLVISQPDARRGRGRKSRPTPVSELALLAGLPLRRPGRIGEVAGEISNHDVLVVAAYGQILRPDVLYAALHGAWNVHASLLPAYRGAAPVEHAIMAGERETGISIMKMDEGLDTGPVALQRKVPIHPNSTGGEITQTLADLGSEAIVEGLGLLEEDRLTFTPQDETSASYASRISPADRVIDWTRDARAVHDHIRALSPHIGARTTHPELDGPVRILRSEVSDGTRSEDKPGTIVLENQEMLVICGVGALRIEELQLPGARRMKTREFLMGNRLNGSFEPRQPGVSEAS